MITLRAACLTGSGGDRPRIRVAPAVPDARAC